MCQMVCHNIQGIRIDHRAEDIQELMSILLYLESWLLIVIALVGRADMCAARSGQVG